MTVVVFQNFDILFERPRIFCIEKFKQSCEKIVLTWTWDEKVKRVPAFVMWPSVLGFFGLLTANATHEAPSIGILA